ncbi:MAG TPA: hypothetical protein VID29_06825 [Solirubrobacteraceae bacterium]|jgi:hypothetical protein
MSNVLGARRWLTLAGAVLALAGPASAAAAGSSARSLPAPRFPTPASALPQGSAKTGSGSALAPRTAAPGVTTTPAAPTTTYVPSTTTPGVATTPGAVRAPGTALPGAPVGAAALPGVRAGQTPAHAGGSSLSTGALVAAVLAALLVLACAGWGVARWYAYEPHWTLSARHACAEAGLRVSVTLGELRDWARIGR